MENTQKKVVDVFWGDETVATMLSKRGLKRDIADAGDLVGVVVGDLGLPKTLKDVGVGRENLDILAENSMKDRCLLTNPTPLKEKSQVLEILAMALGSET